MLRLTLYRLFFSHRVGEVPSALALALALALSSDLETFMIKLEILLVNED